MATPIYSVRHTYTLLTALAMTTYFSSTATELRVIKGFTITNQDPLAQTFSMDYGIGSRLIYQNVAVAPGATFERSELNWVVPASVIVRFGCSKINVLTLAIYGFRFDIP